MSHNHVADEGGALMAVDMKKALAELPASTITVKGGVVTEVQHWTCWNGENWPTITIRRNPDGTFFSDIGDPEHGGCTKLGTLAGVLKGLHPDVQKEYVAVFGATNPTKAQLVKIFPRHKVVFE